MTGVILQSKRPTIGEWPVCQYDGERETWLSRAKREGQDGGEGEGEGHLCPGAGSSPSRSRCGEIKLSKLRSPMPRPNGHLKRPLAYSPPVGEAQLGKATLKTAGKCPE